jgi:hypothetical protein
MQELTDKDENPFPFRVVQRRHAEDVAQNSSVENLDANVAVQQCRDERRDDGEGIPHGLENIGRVGNALIRRVEAVLALVAVDDQPHDHVDDINEDVGDEEALPEVVSITTTVSFVLALGAASNTYGRLISAMSSLKSVAPPYAKTPFIKPAMPFCKL